MCSPSAQNSRSLPDGSDEPDLCGVDKAAHESISAESDGAAQDFYGPCFSSAMTNLRCDLSETESLGEAHPPTETQSKP